MVWIEFANCEYHSEDDRFAAIPLPEGWVGVDYRPDPASKTKMEFSPACETKEEAQKWCEDQVLQPELIIVE